MNNKNILDKSDFVKILLIYNGIKKQINVDKNKQLRYLKNKIYQVFYPINSDIYIKYKNIDYSSFLDEKIGFLFLNKSTVKLVISQKNEIIKTVINNNKQKQKKNVNNETNNVNSENKINESLIENNRYKISESNVNSSSNNKYQKFKLPPIDKSIRLIKNNNINSRNNNFNTPYKLRSYNYNSITCNRKKKDFNFYDINNILKNVYKLKDIYSFKNCVECLKEKSIYYCRSCDKFICETCKTKNHNGNFRVINIVKKKIKNIEHLLLKINYDNISENILNYKNILKKKLMIPYEFLEFIVDESNDNQEKKWKIKFDMKINILINKVDDLNEENSEDLNFSIKKDEIDDIKKYVNECNCSGEENPYKLFKNLYEKDKILKNMIKTDQNNINMVKINNMFYEIENEIDKVLFNLEEKI